MVMKSAAAFALAALTSQVSAAGTGYDFAENGADWPSKFPDCGLTNQSPIDLKTDENAYKTYDFQDDSFNKIYTNQVQKSGEPAGITIEWKNGQTTQVAVNRAGQTTQTFHSKLAESVFGANPRYTGVQFHFHAGSEHTVDGVRHDLEMHTVHLAEETKGGFGYAAMGLIFSVQDYDRSVSADVVEKIDNFFDSMSWNAENPNQANPVVASVPYGDLMMAVDMHNRWVYKGSVTTPPCAQSVYWNVLRTIYPIKSRHLHQFRQQLTRGEKDLAKTGNWREIQNEDDHNVIVVTTERGNGAVVLFGIILVVLSAIAVVIVAVIYMSIYDREKKNDPQQAYELGTARSSARDVKSNAIN